MAQEFVKVVQQEKIDELLERLIGRKIAAAALVVSGIYEIFANFCLLFVLAIDNEERERAGDVGSVHSPGQRVVV